MFSVRRALALAALNAFLIAPAAAAQASANTANDGVRWARRAAETYLERAERAQQRGDSIAALTAFTQALRADPTLGRAYIELAELRRALGDLNEAERLLSRATALNDVRAEALARRARLYREQRRDDLALDDLKSAAESEPSLQRLRELANFYVQQRAWVAALSIWRRVAAHPELTPSAVEAREVTDTLQALSLLAAEADAVQHAMGERSDVRRTLLRHARPALQRAGSPARATSAGARVEKVGARKLAP